MTAIFLIVILAIGIIVFLFFVFKKKESNVCFKQTCFTVEVADNEAKRELGLMFRKTLAQNSGMLFVFSKEDNYPFWMKNTLIPLDMIWMDKDKKVVFIKEDARSCQKTCSTITPGSNAQYVLEINAGLVQKLGIKIGDSVILN